MRDRANAVSIPDGRGFTVNRYPLAGYHSKEAVMADQVSIPDGRGFTVNH